MGLTISSAVRRDTARIKKKSRDIINLYFYFFCWTIQIRTGNDRAKTCSVTITP